MAKVTISNVVVKDNPCVFKNPFQFEITFECIENLNDGTYSSVCVCVDVNCLCTQCFISRYL